MENEIMYPCKVCAKKFTTWDSIQSIVNSFGFCSCKCYTEFFKLTDIGNHCFIYSEKLYTNVRPLWLEDNYRIPYLYSGSMISLVNKKDLETIVCNDMYTLLSIKVLGVYDNSYKNGLQGSLIRAKRKVEKYNLVGQLERYRTAQKMK